MAFTSLVAPEKSAFTPFAARSARRRTRSAIVPPSMASTCAMSTAREPAGVVTSTSRRISVQVSPAPSSVKRPRSDSLAAPPSSTYSTDPGRSMGLTPAIDVRRRSPRRPSRRGATARSPPPHRRGRFRRLSEPAADHRSDAADDNGRGPPAAPPAGDEVSRERSRRDTEQEKNQDVHGGLRRPLEQSPCRTPVPRETRALCSGSRRIDAVLAHNDRAPALHALG